jgi:hypothetical protein
MKKQLFFLIIFFGLLNVLFCNGRKDLISVSDNVDILEDTLIIYLSRSIHNIKWNELYSIHSVNLIKNNEIIDVQYKDVGISKEKFLLQIEKTYCKFTFYNIPQIPDTIVACIRNEVKKLFITLSCIDENTYSIGDVYFYSGNNQKIAENIIRYEENTLELTISRINNDYDFPNTNRLQSISNADLYYNNEWINGNYRYIGPKDERLFLDVEAHYIYLKLVHIDKLPDEIVLDAGGPSRIRILLNITDIFNITITEINTGYIW